MATDGTTLRKRQFGLADRSVYSGRPSSLFKQKADFYPFAVFLIVEWRVANPDGFVPLNNTYKRYLGIGNATGLGMAPFLISHPTLIHNWFHARETALADIRSVPRATAADIAHFESLIAKAAAHVGEWNVEDETQTARIEVLRQEVEEITKWPVSPETEYLWDGTLQRANTEFSLEGQELLVSILARTLPGQRRQTCSPAFVQPGTFAQCRYDGRRITPTIGRSLYVDQTIRLRR